MVKLSGIPTELTPPLVKVGVTVMVPITGAVPLLVAVKEGIPVEFPPLFAARPIPGVSLIQV